MKRYTALFLSSLLLLSPLVGTATELDSETLTSDTAISKGELREKTDDVQNTTPSLDTQNTIDTDSSEEVETERSESTEDNKKAQSVDFSALSDDELAEYLNDPEKYQELLDYIKATTDYSDMLPMARSARANQKMGVAEYMGISRDQLMKRLTMHEYDNYYLGTPFKGLWTPIEMCMSPLGNPNKYGPGFNCTGFVATVFKEAGANMNKITNVANAWGSIANAYNWRDALVRNTEYYAFDSVSQLLNSGKAEKGDVIYFEPDYTKPGYDCHIGFFWGNTPNHNRMWHSYDRNIMSNIKSATPYTKIFLFKLGEKADPNDRGPYIPLGEYVRIKSGNYSVFSDFEWHIKNSSNILLNKTYYAKGKYNHKNGHTYYSLYDSKDKWMGYIDKEAVNHTAVYGEYLSFNQYVTISSSDYNTWTNFDWKFRQSTKELKDQTFMARGEYRHFNGSTYYSLYDIDGKWHGYLNKNATRPAPAQGSYIPYGEYVRIQSPNYDVFQNFGWKVARSSKSLHNKTYLAKGKYHHQNGSVYYSLYDNKNNWLGYINKSATKEVPNYGEYLSFNQYVTINSSNYNTWTNFDWKFRQSTKELKDQTFMARGEYRHFNGSTYYSLYDIDGKWHGYLNKNATRPAPAQGSYIPYGEYVRIQSPNYDVFQNFGWKVARSSKSLHNKTYLAKGKYHHQNGSVYYSLYDNKNNWLGYINKNATKEVPRYGEYISLYQPVKIDSPNYNTWSNFDWKFRQSTKKLKGQSFMARGVYYHFNGSTYYSLYDEKGEWYGYLNKDATVPTN
ncbi:hypothetical protein [Vagococcus lutrae]|uniref:hypothetical protein n=1 Tax=Vagococcus lutrae TaxID=81947 RepID=UPI0028904152|nr:hypothetical protein [Vagococcus lutrae]MDT2825769.1 hypothetical protein [Vagococcus lutrae]